MVKLDETRIYGLNNEWEGGLIDALGLMREIYDKILNADDLWHFFWESSYTVIRHRPGTHQAIAKLVYSYNEGLKVVRKDKGYEENIKITRKYLDAFLHVFHGYSVLAMEMKDKDFLEVFERLNHCFLNPVTRDSITEQFKIPGDTYGTDEHMGWEAIALFSLAHQRSWAAGWFKARYLSS